MIYFEDDLYDHKLEDAAREARDQLRREREADHGRYEHVPEPRLEEIWERMNRNVRPLPDR